MFGNVRVVGPVALAAGVIVGWSGTATAGAQSACADLGGTVDRDQICHVHSATASYQIDFSFPVDYPDQQPLTDFLTQQRDQFVDYAKKYPRGDRPMPYALEATGTAYRSGTPASGTKSLVFDIQNDTGAANAGDPATSHKAFNYDLSKGAPITFGTLFKPGTTPQDVEREVKKSGPVVLPPYDSFGVDGYQNFAITDTAVIFFFDHDVLHQDGAPEVTMPRTELASLLS
jgi:hypothetical protein